MAGEFAAYRPANRRLVVVVEATGALQGFWQELCEKYVNGIVRAFCRTWQNGQGEWHKSALPSGEMTLVVYDTANEYTAGSIIEWTSGVEEFLKRLSAINFGGGGSSEPDVAKGLADALFMVCSPVSDPGPGFEIVRPPQKHCLLIAASNSSRLPTTVTPGLGADTDRFANAQTVAKQFSEKQVSLSVIAPWKLPLLRSIYHQAKQNPEATETESDVSNGHLVLISERFTEAKTAQKVTKIWEGNVVKDGNQKIPWLFEALIKNTEASKMLAADWPATMEIGRLFANGPIPEGRLVVYFVPFGTTGLLDQLREKRMVRAHIYELFDE